MLAKKLIASDNYHRVNAKILNYCTIDFVAAILNRFYLSPFIDFNILEHFFFACKHTHHFQFLWHIAFFNHFTVAWPLLKLNRPMMEKKKSKRVGWAGRNKNWFFLSFASRDSISKPERFFAFVFSSSSCMPTYTFFFSTHKIRRNLFFYRLMRWKWKDDDLIVVILEQFFLWCFNYLNLKNSSFLLKLIGTIKGRRNNLEF